MKGIVWLASYPKSGNTWFRAFLTNYLRDADRPAGINHLDDDPIASARRPFDEAIGYDSGEMSFDEADALRPEVYIHQANTANRTLYCKAHDAFTRLPDGRLLFPPEATQAALYFVRNPLDVAVSYAHHNGGRALDDIIEWMADEGHCFCAARGSELNQLRQKLLSWSAHVASWADAKGLRVHIMRYEDMRASAEDSFSEAIRFLDLPLDHRRLQKAIHFSRFDELRQQEEKSGFMERPPAAHSFFRKGEVGSWRAVLTEAQTQKILGRHATVMRRLGYLTADGQPTIRPIPSDELAPCPPPH